MSRKQRPENNPHIKQTIIAVMLLFLAAVFLLHCLKQFQNHASLFSRLISICGVLLFGGTGGTLLADELRSWIKKRKK